MASASAPPVGRARAVRRRVLLSLSLLSLVVAGTLLPHDRRAAAGGPPAAQVVPAVVAAYPPLGTLAVVVAKQQVPVDGLSVRAAEARSARLAASTAGNAAADRPFPTASMVKLFMAEDILHRARAGRLVLRPDDPALLREMIRSSDDPAASELWVRYGGGQMVIDVARRYRLTGTAPPQVPGRWGEATTTARDLARFLATLPSAAHPDDAGALLGWMREATPLAADGFDQRFGVLGTAPPQTAVKQGWMCCVGGNRHLHSVGIVGHRVVVLLSEVPRGTGYDDACGALTAAASAVPAPAGP
ncbi:serine hydrolase [Blastococcus haudaquaticus]|uniref:Beta-lactamase enzyme family protein n=1 Tax=Blastococcus haudaquaticus TaxID=1938745 RepID=A0A286GPC3_9ACTN|nr:serine hydrolase [Blastococcus haudaquaticus]SOD97368.1 Beta-lactamase enzyme family protein [Blastococcus haudaquaticus]